MRSEELILKRFLEQAIRPLIVQFTHFTGRKKMDIPGLSMAAFLTIPLIRKYQ